jgi:S1-C subfamily serine protease
MAEAGAVKVGQWCAVTGHPGGFQQDRKPVMRLGRVLLSDRFAITTDCTLVGGDSGGPLFDMEGRVIGVNSRIGRFLTANMHVPISAYRESWDRLVKGESWGHFPGTGPYIGVLGDTESNLAKIARVFEGAPAAKAGIKNGDIIVKFNGKKVTDFASLQMHVNDCQPGDKVKVEVMRQGKPVQLDLTVGKRR